MTASTVAIATPQYEAGIMDLCRLLYEENGILPVNYAKVGELVHCALHRLPSNKYPLPGIIGAIGSPEKPEATICLQLCDVWYSDDWALKDIFNFVHPDHRKSAHARDLIEFAKDIADQMGLPLFMGVVSDTRTEAKIRLLERAMPKIGALFVYRGKEA